MKGFKFNYKKPEVITGKEILKTIGKEVFKRGYNYLGKKIMNKYIMKWIKDIIKILKDYFVKKLMNF